MSSIRDETYKNFGYDWNENRKSRRYTDHVSGNMSLSPTLASKTMPATMGDALRPPPFDWVKAANPKKKRFSSGNPPPNEEPSFDWETASPKSVIVESRGAPSFDWAQARQEKLCKSKSLGSLMQPPSSSPQAPSFDWKKSTSLRLLPPRKSRGSNLVRSRSTDSSIIKESEETVNIRKSKSVDNLVQPRCTEEQAPSFDWKKTASLRLPPRMPQRRQRRSQGSNLVRTQSTDSGITKKKDKTPKLSKSKSLDSLVTSSSSPKQAPSFDWKKSASSRQLPQPRRQGSNLGRTGSNDNEVTEKRNKTPKMCKSKSLDRLAQSPPAQKEAPSLECKNTSFRLLPCMPQLPRWQSRGSNSERSQSNGSSVKPPKMPLRQAESQPDLDPKKISLPAFNLGPRIFDRFLGKQS